MRAERTILITGCSTGIGRCVAEGLRTRGWRVFASARKPEDVRVLKAHGFEALRLDVADSASIDEAVDAVFSRTDGTLYALFNNAGYAQPGAVEDLSREALRAQFETNLFGLVELTARVIPAMRRQGAGRIVMNSSVLGFVAMPYRGAYNASKYAVEGITDTLRLELKGSGVHAVLIEPGPIASRFRDNALTAFGEGRPAAESPHHARYLAMETGLGKNEGLAAYFTRPPEAVLEKVIRALEASRPKARYRVTTPSHLFAGLKRILPQSALDFILSRQ